MQSVEIREIARRGREKDRGLITVNQVLMKEKGYGFLSRINLPQQEF